MCKYVNSTCMSIKTVKYAREYEKTKNAVINDLSFKNKSLIKGSFKNKIQSNVV